MSLIKERKFNKTIGFFGLLMLGTGATLGAGVFSILGNATIIAGPSVVIAFAINFFLAIIIALHYAEMSALSPVEGGGYSFIEEAFGSSAYYVGWLIWMGNMAYASFCALVFSLYVTSGTTISAMPVAIATLTIFAAINLIGISSVIEVEKLLAVVRFGILIIFIRSIQSCKRFPKWSDGFDTRNQSCVSLLYRFRDHNNHISRG
jgi:APA family basic amino acid/polyamine antiporter